MAKYKSKKQTDTKRVKEATAIDAKVEKGGLFRRFLSKIKK